MHPKNEDNFKKHTKIEILTSKINKKRNENNVFTKMNNFEQILEQKHDKNLFSQKSSPIHENLKKTKISKFNNFMEGKKFFPKNEIKYQTPKKKKVIASRLKKIHCLKADLKKVRYKKFNSIKTRRKFQEKLNKFKSKHGKGLERNSLEKSKIINYETKCQCSCFPKKSKKKTFLNQYDFQSFPFSFNNLDFFQNFKIKNQNEKTNDFNDFSDCLNPEFFSVNYKNRTRKEINDIWKKALKSEKYKNILNQNIVYFDHSPFA